ncbi:hypothetical protein FHU37_000713 [Allostreptomyces psammosilenae]|uniref:N-acetylmuramoyl-L-alanine amidase domain-containing protein n=1 Tax=Allostreptomyces psammosilenae TaxID=1892865 RepID=A0A852ZR59_9ACTN|nr:hypothetical protein [Allostreptomyces psammosilenae]
MATPLSADAFLAALRAEGVTVVEVGDWRNHNRNHVGAWGPVHGVMIHHTVTSGSAATVELCRVGHADLPGPLCHGVITKDGRVHLVGYGRANHAGGGDPDVLDAVIAETALPADNESTTDGNTHFYGFECENLGDGEDPWPAEQLEAIERAAAAVCRAHGWGAGSVIGHLEWQPGKVDPRGFTMNDMRGRIADRLAGNTEDDMALSEEDLDRIAYKVWSYHNGSYPTDIHNAVVQTYWAVGEKRDSRVPREDGGDPVAYYTGDHVAATNGVVYGLRDQIEELRTQLATLSEQVNALSARPTADTADAATEPA